MYRLAVVVRCYSIAIISHHIKLGQTANKVLESETSILVALSCLGYIYGQVHIGSSAGSGLDLGTADCQLMHGRHNMTRAVLPHFRPPSSLSAGSQGIPIRRRMLGDLGQHKVVSDKGICVW